jgi:NhaP-type Na+/H+ or K+/H+ antiporter
MELIALFGGVVIGFCLGWLVFRNNKRLLDIDPKTLTQEQLEALKKKLGV